ncbi:MAG: CusA/CzcA family heavy metal efflux RND transporter [Vulcanimicrobiota bacterium]
MIDRLIESIIREHRLVLVSALILFLAGLYAASRLNIEAYPDPAPPLIEVLAQRPGWSAEEMERLVTVPLETQLNGMPRLQHLRSSSLFGLTDIRCYFAHGSSYASARQEVINRLTLVDLPEGIQPALSPQSTIGEILRYELVGPQHSLLELKELNDWFVQRQFRQVPGVIDMTSWGGPTKEYQLVLDPNQLVRFDLGLDEVISQLARSNSNVGGSYLPLGPQSYNVRGVGLIRSVADIEQALMAERKGMPVLASALGKAQLGRAIPLGRVGRDDKPDIVEGIVLMRVGEKTYPTLQGVHRKIEQLNHGLLPSGVRIVAYSDRSHLLQQTTVTVQHTMVSGMLLVVFILLAFLGDLRASLIVAITIPLSLAIVFLLMVLLDQSANLISMGALDFGIIVDASVIMIENIHRHFSDSKLHPPGQDPLETCVRAAQEVARPIFFSDLVLFVSFIPLFTMKGVEAKIFGPMALTYALALLVALVLSRTFAPSAAAIWIKPPAPGRVHQETMLVRILRRPYAFMLDACLKNRWAAAVLAALSFSLSMLLVLPRLGGEYMPKLEEGNLWVRGTLPTSISFEDASRIADQARRVFADCPQVRTVVSQLGRPDDATDPTSWFNMEFFAALKPRSQWPAGLEKPQLVRELDARLRQRFPDVVFGFSQAIQDNVEEAMSGVKGENSIKLIGNDLKTLEDLAHQVELALHDVPGVHDLGTFHILGQPNLVITPRRELAARYGLTVAEINDTIQAALGGRVVTQVLEGDRRFDLTVRFAEAYRDSPAEIARLPLRTKNQQWVPLEQVADIQRQGGAGLIYREDNQRYIPVKFSVRERDLTGTIQEIESRLASQVNFPPGYSWQIAGEFGQLQEALARFQLVIPITILLIFLILARSFGRAREALVVLGCVPLCWSGGLLALWLRSMPLSISSGVGLISLSGVCVLEAVLLVALMKAASQRGLAGIYEASMLRLRPVLMVALAAAVGLLPAALSHQIGSETQKPLATVVVGGMLSSVAVILLILPAIYGCLLDIDGQDKR